MAALKSDLIVTGKSKLLPLTDEIYSTLNYSSQLHVKNAVAVGLALNSILYGVYEGNNYIPETELRKIHDAIYL